MALSDVFQLRAPATSPFLTPEGEGRMARDRTLDELSGRYGFSTTRRSYGPGFQSEAFYPEGIGREAGFTRETHLGGDVYRQNPYATTFDMGETIDITGKFKAQSGDIVKKTLTYFHGPPKSPDKVGQDAASLSDSMGTKLKPSRSQIRRTPYKSLSDEVEGKEGITADKSNLWAAAIVGRYIAEVFNTQTKYEVLRTQNRLNWQIASDNAVEAIARGMQRGFMRRQQGRRRAEQAKIYLAAQGQDVHSAHVARAEMTFETAGTVNGMIEEMNGDREALGYQSKMISYEMQNKLAETQRDLSIIGSTVTMGIRLGGLYL